LATCAYATLPNATDPSSIRLQSDDIIIDRIEFPLRIYVAWGSTSVSIGGSGSPWIVASKARNR
jgi:hypothetical protein